MIEPSSTIGSSWLAVNRFILVGWEWAIRRTGWARWSDWDGERDGGLKWVEKDRQCTSSLSNTSQANQGDGTQADRSVASKWPVNPLGRTRLERTALSTSPRTFSPAFAARLQLCAFRFCLHSPSRGFQKQVLSLSSRCRLLPRTFCSQEFFSSS